MKRTLLLLYKLMTMVGLFWSMSAFPGEIALTFDDAPLPGGNVMSGKEKTQRIIQQLKSRGVNEALFYVTGKNLYEESSDRLSAYVNAGFYLANHSYAHKSANKISVDDVLVDAYRTHLILKRYGKTLPYYRFPYLHNGNDNDSRKAILSGLKELGYSNGYVTVDNYDWYINKLYLQYKGAGKKINSENMKELYVDLLWGNIQFYDELAKDVLGRSPKHVLLLHENEVAALYLGDLVDHVRSKGWKIISPVEAYQDPLAGVSHDLSFSKQGRVAAVAHYKGVAEELLRHKNENVDYIKRMFEHYNVIEN